MVYFPAGSKEDEIISKKLADFGKSINLRERVANGNNQEEEVNKKPNFLARLFKRKKSPKDSTKEYSNETEEDNGGLKDNKDLFKSKKGKLKKFVTILVLIAIILGGVFYYRTSSLISKISTTGGSLFGGLFKDVEDVKGMEDGQINVLLIGMRGQNMPGGSLLADSIMVISVKPQENKVAMISIPRDLYVEIPGKNYSRKINEANPIGEEEGKGNGLELMKEVVGNVTGLNIHYAVSANFDALRDTVDVLGGITVHLDKPFYEGKQFVEGNECGGEFELPAGDVQLSGEKALCYSRARFATSDFDRARRQQEVLLAIKDKALSVGTLSDFSKVNNLLDVMGDNIRTDMKPWEMQKLYEIQNQINDPQIYREVLDNSENGLLYSTSNGSYILLPVGDNYNRIHETCLNIFNE